jgi:hypothetical protein
VRLVASAIAEAADDIIDAYRERRIVYEPSITERLFGAIETKVNGLMTPASGFHLPLGGGIRLPIRWEAMSVLAGSRSSAHEQRFGADILGVLTMEGFVAQAKRSEPRSRFSTSEWSRLRDQCEKMLRLTPDAFVVIYSLSRGVRFFSAQDVYAFAGRNIFDLYDIGVRSFFEKHLQSFIGDRRLDKPDVSVLENLYADEREPARPSAHVLHLKATEAE